MLGFVLVREPQQVWLIYVLTAIQSASQGFYFPAWNAILPDITKPHELGVANALSSATWSVMLAFGAALGGLVSGVVGVYPAFVIDGVTFLVSALILLRMPYQSLLTGDSDKSIVAGIRQYLDGLAYLRRHIDTFSIAIHKGVWGAGHRFFRSCKSRFRAPFPIAKRQHQPGLIYVMWARLRHCRFWGATGPR